MLKIVVASFWLVLFNGAALANEVSGCWTNDIRGG